MNRITMALALACASGAMPAAAQQFTAAPTVVRPNGLGTSYTGPINPGGSYGSLGSDAYYTFDAFGIWQNVPNQLSISRQTELLANTNTFRFLDTFTNTGPTAYTGQVTFFGNLGSDSRTRVLQGSGGMFVSCEDAGAGCTNTPVIALVYGNATSATMANDLFHANYTLTLAPGQSASILNAAFLARTAAGPDAQSQALALSTANALLASPPTAGLTAAQMANVVNFDLAATAAVPEPATWAMTILGFGMIGGLARRRRPAGARARLA